MKSIAQVVRIHNSFRGWIYLFVMKIIELYSIAPISDILAKSNKNSAAPNCKHDPLCGLMWACVFLFFVWLRKHKESRIWLWEISD